MNIRLKKLDEQVIVITGASRGDDLTTARHAVRRGAAVVLAARDQGILDRLGEEFRGAGGRALAVAADVSRFEDVKNLANKAIEEFGAFDTWVNDAGGSVYGRIADVPIEEERKVFESNYWGAVYGSRVVVDHLREQSGALINLGSVASD
jgi:NADP-dependent 3-hydroxy acid dehydrogenase YdfG